MIGLLADGVTDKQIGHALFIPPKRVGNHFTHIREKTNCSNRAEALPYASDHGLLDRDE